MSREPHASNRRTILKMTGTAIAGVGLAGCSGDGGDGGGGSDGGDGGDGGGSTSGGGGGEPLDITIAHVQSPQHVGVQGLQAEFADKLEEETDGRITVNIEAGSLGGSEDVLDAAQAGTVEMVMEGVAAAGSRFAPGYTFGEDPFVIRDNEHYKAVQEEFILTEDGMNGEMIPQGLRMFESHYWGNRGTTSNKEIHSTEDVQGLDIRLPQFDSWVGAWNEIGANATPVAFDELYSALETGVVEASEGPITQFMGQSLYEVQSHFTVTDHLLGRWHFIMNEDFYQGLSDSDRELLTSFIPDAADRISQHVQDAEAGVYEEAEAEGTTIIPREDVEREGFVEAAQPFLEEWSSENWAVSLDDVQSL